MSGQERELTVKETAQLEVWQEQFRARVDVEKAIIRAKRARPWWHTIIPFTVEIRRRKP